MVGLGRRDRMTLLAILDSIAWFVTIPFAFLVVFTFDAAEVPWVLTVMLSALAVCVDLVAGLVVGLHMGRWRVGSFEEAGAVVAVDALAGLGLLISVRWVGAVGGVALSVTVIAVACHVLLAWGYRYTARSLVDSLRRTHHVRPHRVLVFGAGEAGLQAARALQVDPDSDAQPVGFLDDDPQKAFLRVRGLPVLGTRADLHTAAAAQDADILLLACPSAPRRVQSEVGRLAAEAGLHVRFLPSTVRLVRDPIGIGDIREFTLADYLGRAEIRTDLEGVAALLKDRRILVTGAGGSIGSELCRAIAAHGPACLYALDRDETLLHDLGLSLDHRAPDQPYEIVLCDVRDRTRVRSEFDRIRPDVVFHAAALKHVPLLEAHPDEAVETNVVGSIHVLEAAAAFGVERFVNISTDKAANPTNVLGATKRITEMLTAGTGEGTGGTYISVRFGNVLGSRGSVIPTFESQIRDGGPITITHPDVTRYFMTVSEAVQLVLQAGVLGEDGKVLILDMGDPVRILDVARHLATALRPREEIEIVFTGLRPGEKLHEELWHDRDAALRRVHRSMWSTAVPALGIPEFFAVAARREGACHERASVMALLEECGRASISPRGHGSVPVQEVPM
ncbi:MAG: polysaccharide biosynthesis protein [Acidimicrobiia bacterium]|nr:polysaccharide biosynthesis protein [Acidimicrobiia bacterium]